MPPASATASALRLAPYNPPALPDNQDRSAHTLPRLSVSPGFPPPSPPNARYRFQLSPRALHRALSGNAPLVGFALLLPCTSAFLFGKAALLLPPAVPPAPQTSPAHCC